MEFIENANDEKICPICHEILGENFITTEECETNHKFHKECLGTWCKINLKDGTTCPSCREAIPFTCDKLIGPESTVFSVAFSPDGKTVVSGSADTTVRIWDVGTGDNTQVLKGHTGAVYSVAFSPDGKTVVSGSQDGTIRTWDVELGLLLKTLEDDDAELEDDDAGVVSVAFSPDGKTLVSGSLDGNVRIWDVEMGNMEQIMEQHEDEIETVAFSPDGKMVVSADVYGTICIWNLKKDKVQNPNPNPNPNRKVQTMKKQDHFVKSVVFSRDGSKVVSCSSDLTVCEWDVKSERCIEKLKSAHTKQINSVAFSPNRKYVVSDAIDDDNTFVCITVVDSRAAYILGNHDEIVNSVAFSPDGTQVVSGSGKTVKIWNVPVPAQVVGGNKKKTKRTKKKRTKKKKTKKRSTKKK